MSGHLVCAADPVGAAIVCCAGAAGEGSRAADVDRAREASGDRGGGVVAPREAGPGRSPARAVSGPVSRPDLTRDAGRTGDLGGHGDHLHTGAGTTATVIL